MADFAPNFTPRLRIGYRVESTNHEFTWRLPRGTHIAGVTPYIDKVTAFLAALEGILYSDWVVQTASFAEEDSDIFLPVGAPGTPTGAGDPTGRLQSQRALFLQFVGRGAAGSKGSFYIYGSVVNIDSTVGQDFRITNAENGSVSGANGVLTETGDPLHAIDDSLMHWYPYVNVKPNDHYVHKIRNGG